MPLWRCQLFEIQVGRMSVFSQPYLVRSRLCYSVCPSVCRRLSPSADCTECIVTKWCVLEQKLLLTAYNYELIWQSYMSNRLVPKWMTLTFVYRPFKVMSTIAPHSPLNISETVMPNTHRRRRRDSTVELSRVGVASASAVCIEFATSSRRLPTKIWLSWPSFQFSAPVIGYWG